MNRKSLNISGFFSLAAVVPVVLSSTLMLATTASAQETTAGAAPASPRAVEARESGADISKIKPAKPKPAPAAGQPQLPGGSQNFAGSCCSPPTPFPGLHCCDTRDCGWFSCDDNISEDKKFKR